jgi:hypothetical protein
VTTLKTRKRFAVHEQSNVFDFERVRIHVSIDRSSKRHYKLVWSQRLDNQAANVCEGLPGTSGYGPTPNRYQRFEY